MRCENDKRTQMIACGPDKSTDDSRSPGKSLGNEVLPTASLHALDDQITIVSRADPENRGLQSCPRRKSCLMNPFR